eukprot:9417358-Pyramimonas_sp.AAC.1
MVEGLTGNALLRYFFSVRKYLGEELNFPVAGWFNKGLMAVWSPTKPCSLMMAASSRDTHACPIGLKQTP